MPLDKLKQCDNGNIEQCDNGNIVRCCTFGEVFFARGHSFGYNTGIGGNKNIVWAGFVGDYYIAELSTIDLTTIRKKFYFSLEGLGGDEDNIWACIDDHYIAEFSTIDFSKIREKESFSSGQSAGGDENVIWECCLKDYGDNEYVVAEASVVDFSVIQQKKAPKTTYGLGIGGNENVVFFCGHGTVDNLFELNPVDLSTLFVGDLPDEPTHKKDVGGDDNTLWHAEATFTHYPNLTFKLCSQRNN